MTSGICYDLVKVCKSIRAVLQVKVVKLDELPFEEEELSPEIVLPQYQFYQAQQQQQQQ